MKYFRTEGCHRPLKTVCGPTVFTLVIAVCWAVASSKADEPGKLPQQKAFQMPESSRLYNACALGRAELVRERIKAGDDVNEKYFTSSPLLVAVANGHFEVVLILLDNGANPNAVNNDGESALHLLATGIMVEACLPVGVHIDKVDRGSLKLAMYRKGIEFAMITLLLHKGADPKLLNKEGLSPHDYAVKSERRSLIDLLDPKKILQNRTAKPER